MKIHKKNNIIYIYIITTITTLLDEKGSKQYKIMGIIPDINSIDKAIYQVPNILSL